jgi:hypothetical protein
LSPNVAARRASAREREPNMSETAFPPRIPGGYGPEAGIGIKPDAAT